MTYIALIVSAVCSFTLCVFLTPVLRNLAMRLGWVDAPDLDRKLHEVAVPRIGGVPVVIACLVSLGVLASTDVLRGPLDGATSFVLQVLPASILILVTGILDDLIGLRPLQKLAGQSVAAFLVCLAGLRFHFWDAHFLGDVWGFALAFAWLVACSNAFNLIDGVDGLAAGLGLIAALTMLFVALSWSNVAVGVLAASMAGALLGFLYFNVNPASIFLGDSGSLWTGFMLGCFGLVWFQKSATMPSKIAPVIALAVPLTDMTLSIVRRFVSEKPIFSADHGHIHHRLLDRLPPRHVTLGLCGVSVLGSLFAVALGMTSELTGYGIAAVVCVIAWIGVRSLAYEEFKILGGLIRSIRTMVRYRLSLIAYESRLKNAVSPEACWFVLLRAGREFGFSDLTLQLGGRHFHERSIPRTPEEWVMRIPLSPSDYLNLARRCNSATAADVVTRLADLCQRTLSEKSAAFRPKTDMDRRRLVVHGTDLYST